MSNETLLVITVLWLAIGLVGFRWAAVTAGKERDEGPMSELEESSVKQAALRHELEAAHAELLSLRAECADLRAKNPA